MSTWELTDTWVSNADLSRSLWPDSITRTGKAGDGPDVPLPQTTLLPVQRPNRVDERSTEVVFPAVGDGNFELSRIDG